LTIKEIGEKQTGTTAIPLSFKSKTESMESRPPENKTKALIFYS